MKKFGIVFCTLLALAGCKGEELKLEEFVAAPVALEIPADQAGAEVTVKGTIPFTNTRYYTAYTTECSRYVCGTESYQDCDNVQRCTGGGHTTCRPVQRCTGGGTSCRNVERCTPSGCTTDRVCRTVPRSCHTDSVCHTTPPTCHTERVCHTAHRDRYCTGECRRVPYQASDVKQLPTAVTVKVKGLAPGEKKLKLEDLVLGVKTSDKFREIIAKPSEWPKGSEGLFRNLKATDRTVIALRAKGYELAPNQSFLELPADFKAGDPLTIELELSRTGKSKSVLSAVGTEVDVPELNSSEHE